MINKRWVDYVKSTKQRFVEADDRGELLPTIVAVKDGKITAELTAADLDKRLGIIGSSIVWNLFSPDEMIVLLDAHIWVSKQNETLEDYHRKFPNGMQQACDQENLCDTGDITDVIIVNKITADGNLECYSVPYSYHGKGSTFRWLDQDERYSILMDAEYTAPEGIIADGLRAAIAQKTNIASALTWIHTLGFTLKTL